MNGDIGTSSGLIELRLRRLDYEPGAALARVVLDEATDPMTSMTIALPATHAVSLMRALTSTAGGCSPTCDVILAPVRRLVAAIMHVVLDERPDGISAWLAVAPDGGLLFCEIADALTLAVRAGVPVYGTHRALNVV